MRNNCVLVKVNSEIDARKIQEEVNKFYSTEFMKKAGEIEQIIIKRARTANIGVQKLVVDVYNKTHNDYELKITDYGIVKVVK